MRRLFMLLALLGPLPASAQDPLDLIPQAVLDAPAPAPAAPAGGVSRSYWLEGFATATDWRRRGAMILPPPGNETPGGVGTLRLNGRGEWKLDERAWSLAFDTRIETALRSDSAFAWGRDARLDVKELYLSWRDATLSVDAGRINIRNGVAAGFNPTDYYRTNAVVSRTSEDPGKQREDRLGTLAVRLMQVWDGASLTLVAAPDLGRADDRWWASEDVYGFNFDRTNDRARLTARLATQFGTGTTLEGLVHYEDAAPGLGVNLSHGIGDAWVLHAEAVLANRRTILDESRRGALGTWFGGDGGRDWGVQGVLGAAWTAPANITTTLELHYNGFGLDRGDWRRWFTAARATAESPGPGSRTAGRLWSIRQLARDRQEPLAQMQLFLRSSWPEAFDPDLTLTALATLNPYDGSALAQIEAAYTLTPRTVLTARLITNTGARASEYGSNRRALSGLIQIARYF